MCTKKLQLIVLISLLLIAGVSQGVAFAEEGVLSIGSITDEPKEEIADFQPFIDYLAGHLKEQGIKSGKVVIANSITEMGNLVKEGKVDLFIDSPFPVIMVGRISGSKPFLKRWKDGLEQYHSVVFAREDSGIESISDLEGKMIAFEESFSTSSYFLPKSTLMKEGLNLAKKDTFSDSVFPDQVGYVFSCDDEATMMWVLRKKIAAGALSNKKFVALAKSKIDELKILKETIAVPRQVLSHCADLDPKLVTAIEDVLVNMDKDEEGIAILKNFSKTKKFDKFPGGAEKSLQPIEALITFVEEELSGK